MDCRDSFAGLIKMLRLAPDSICRVEDRVAASPTHLAPRLSPTRAVRLLGTSNMKLFLLALIVAWIVRERDRLHCNLDETRATFGWS